VKTGVASKYLRPTLGIVDWDNTRTQPAAVAACAGLDVLSHALESYTALPYQQRPRPARPSERAAYQGSNPMSDVWALRALELVADFLPRAVVDPSDDEARAQMIMASSMAGIGFGNSGVHVPHAMAYPVAGMVRDFHPPGYATPHALVPHGMSVILHTPAVARFTAPTSPERHLLAAKALGADISRAKPKPADAGQILADRVIYFMQKLNMPNGLKQVGYSSSDIPALVEGTLPQQRILKLSPRSTGPDELARLFDESLTIW
jgi:hydroxyacid-oxoacid transhydrogenase